MSKQKKKTAVKEAHWLQKHLMIALGVVAVVLVAAVGLYLNARPSANVKVYQEKLALLEASVLTEETETAVGTSSAGGQAGYAVFISICNTAERASVFCGTGADLRSAWKAADEKATDFLTDSNYDPTWVKADVVRTSQMLDWDELKDAVRQSRSEFFRYGIAFDRNYETALLEAELNGSAIYDYNDGGLSLKALNSYLSKAGQKPLAELPNAFTLFQCLGWFCDADNTVYPLYSSGLEYGRRIVERVDGDYAQWLTANAASFLANQVKEDGAFIYGVSPRFDQENKSYNILRHAGTTWAMICQYRASGDKTLEEPIRKAIDYLLSTVVYQDEDTAYIYEEKSDEIKLGGCGISILALIEYMETFEDQSYQDICEKLGNGILALMNEKTGGYYHVLNRDFSLKAENRTVFYDGEATFALCRLYGATKDERWLDAAQKAVKHFIAEDYTQYMDHWVAYAMNEITKYVDDPDYFNFGLRNAQVNMKKIRNAKTSSHIYLELLMNTFELYDRAMKNGVDTGDFDLQALLDTISVRVNRQLDGYFYPECAMYMENPRRILNTFMVRHDGYRVRIDDVQHNIGGLYLYYRNYDKLLDYGLLDGDNADSE